MGRLFWKFFLAFWLALLLAGAAVGSLVWLHQQRVARDEPALAAGPRAALALQAAAATPRHGSARPATAASTSISSRAASTRRSSKSAAYPAGVNVLPAVALSPSALCTCVQATQPFAPATRIISAASRRLPHT